MPTKSRHPTEIVQSIDAKANQVREAAEQLTKRILQFEYYLSQLRGRVETVCYTPHPDYVDIELGLKFHREGKSWIISWGNYNPQFHDIENPIDWHPVKDAPLKIKIVAVRSFPDLLAAIEKTQDSLVVEIETASKEFDAFAETLKASVKGGA